MYVWNKISAMVKFHSYKEDQKFMPSSETHSIKKNMCWKWDDIQLTELGSVVDSIPLETHSKNLRFLCSRFISVCSWRQYLVEV